MAPFHIHNMTRELRLKRILQEQVDRLGSLSALARAINEAHAKSPGPKRKRGIGRRKLADLLNGDDVPLYISELGAIDDYLNGIHQGLAFVPIFERTTLLATLAAQEEVHFLVGARELHNNISLSHFDTSAYADLGRQLSRPSPAATCVLEVVLLRPNRKGARNLQEEPYHRTLQHESAVVAIASPLSNPATEWMLWEMFGRPADASPFELGQRPGVAFVLPDSYEHKVSSPFIESPSQLPATCALKAREIRDRCWALRVGDEVFVAEPEHEDLRRSKTYGVIVAQRRASGAFWVVAAGLHGAGTHAAALALPGAEISLASGRVGQDGPVHVRVVEAHVTFTRTSNGTKLGAVESHRILARPSASHAVV